MGEETQRCISCGNAHLNRLEIRTRAVEDRIPQGIGAKLCRFCNIIYLIDSNLRVSNGKEIIEIMK